MTEGVGVKSARLATKLAESILREYPFRRPIKAQKTGDIWYVQIDVGVLKQRIANFKIDAKTGAVLEYEVPSEEG